MCSKALNGEKAVGGSGGMEDLESLNACLQVQDLPARP